MDFGAGGVDAVFYPEFFACPEFFYHTFFFDDLLYTAG